MADRNPLDRINRRDLFMGAGLFALLGMQDALAGGHTGPRVQLSEEEQAALEKANDKLVADFVRDYNTRDASVLDKYVSDDGKIRVWRDFSYPGAKQLIKPAPKA